MKDSLHVIIRWRISFPLAGYGSQDEERGSSANPQHGKALYDFTAGGDDEVI